jgi:outer membrane lipoprotein SlyB
MNKLLIAVAVAATLSACATSSPDVVSRNEAQRLSQIQDATVLSVRPVVIDGSQSGAGAVTGGVVGGIAGASVGGHREAVAVGVLAAVAGAVVGNAIERAGTREEALEILVQLRNGERRSIIQAKGTETLTPGEPVILVSSNGKTRVMRAPAVTQPAPVPAAPAHQG